MQPYQDSHFSVCAFLFVAIMSLFLLLKNNRWKLECFSPVNGLNETCRKQGAKVLIVYIPHPHISNQLQSNLDHSIFYIHDCFRIPHGQCSQTNLSILIDWCIVKDINRRFSRFVNSTYNWNKSNKTNSIFISSTKFVLNNNVDVKIDCI